MCFCVKASYMAGNAGLRDTCLKEASLEPSVLVEMMWLKLCSHEKNFPGLVFSTSWWWYGLKGNTTFKWPACSLWVFLSSSGTKSFSFFEQFSMRLQKKIPNSCLWAGQHCQYTASSQILPVSPGKTNLDFVMVLICLAYCTHLSKVGQFGFL